MKLSFIITTCFAFLISSTAFAQNKPVVKKNASVNSAVTSVANGKQVYLKYCLTCHMADGGGVPNMNPPLIKTTYVLGDKVRLIKIVLNGFTQNVDIDGQSYSNVMPPQSQLTDQQIADVLTYVRSNFTNKASGVSLAEVKAVKAAAKK